MLPAIRLRLLPLSFLQLVSVFWLRCHAALGFSPPESSRRSKTCVRLHGISTTEISGVDVTVCSLSHSGQTVRVEVRGGLGRKFPLWVENSAVGILAHNAERAWCHTLRHSKTHCQKKKIKAT